MARELMQITRAEDQSTSVWIRPDLIEQIADRRNSEITPPGSETESLIHLSDGQIIYSSESASSLVEEYERLIDEWED